MKVEFQHPGLPVYNQRMDLELSTQRVGLRFLQCDLHLFGRWIGAGWFTQSRRVRQGSQQDRRRLGRGGFRVRRRNRRSRTRRARSSASPGKPAAMLMAASRGDLIEKAGMKMPTTFDELMEVCDAVNGKEGVSAYVDDRLHHWNWMPYLMGMGGKVFRNPPET